AWCDVPFDHCQIHHITFWEHGGATDLHELIPLCSRHHHQIHEGNWTIRLDQHRNLHIIKPNGHTWAIKPPPSAAYVTKRTGHQQTLRKQPDN
ncbi:MAG: HNH endonuclease, partial [Acidimicrobiales bacterium]|nr:HNH endonuclease [Acidimicrobiales bacterium]